MYHLNCVYKKKHLKYLYSIFSMLLKTVFYLKFNLTLIIRILITSSLKNLEEIFNKPLATLLFKPPAVEQSYSNHPFVYFISLNLISISAGERGHVQRTSQHPDLSRPGWSEQRQSPAQLFRHHEQDRQQVPQVTITSYVVSIFQCRGRQATGRIQNFVSKNLM